ncbi:MAG: GNAT family N-acetyltransferase [Pyrinomonadaceae bacterium]|nr:GNAT family N-acetyltransferase [Pyrinomonadaceae bacterium]MCX7638979.1 GNAT family N-acetyltransferase [Pyrinomonadaceae bacterium]MDW8303802.1 GNAT family N-acyltransferase [Acidobacteriota bacterium]
MLYLGQTIYRSVASKLQKSLGYFQTKGVPKHEIVEGRYIVKFASTADEIDAALRLRFEVFNLELNEGLESSFLTGRDQDEFDSNCHHLIVIEKESGKVVGTYRLQTLELAKSVYNFYSAGEFEIEKIPIGILKQSVEIGRACIAREHRNNRVLFLLWKGLALYLSLKKKRYFFGCCSIPTLDVIEGLKAFERLKKEKRFHPTLRIQPRSEYVCKSEVVPDDSQVQLPKLFNTYLRIGAKVCSEPAIDRQFKTIDFFVIFDAETIEKRYYDMFFKDFENLRRKKLYKLLTPTKFLKGYRRKYSEHLLC